MTDPEAPSERPPVTVAVIGAGVSGLAAARVLAGLEPVSAPEDWSATMTRPRARELRVVVLEAGPAAGGKVVDSELAGNRVESGPDQFLRRNPSAERLCRHLGLGDDLVSPAASSAAVWSRGEMRGMPRGLVLGIPTDLDAVASSGIVSAEGVARARLDGGLAGPLLSPGEVGLAQGTASAQVQEQERAAGEILRARLGDEVVDRLVDPLLGGINAGSVDTMSLGTAAPQIAQALVGHRDVIAPLAARVPPPSGDAPLPSPFFGLRGGLSRLVEACCQELRAAGVEIRTSSAVTAIRRGGEGTPGGAGGADGPGGPGGGRPTVRALCAPRAIKRELFESGRAGADGGSPRWLVDTDGGVLACDGIVLAVPGFAGAELTRGVAPELAAELGGVPYAGVAVVTLAFRDSSISVPAGSTGVLVPRVEGRLMTATTWLSAKWPWMSGSGAGPPRSGPGSSGPGPARSGSPGPGPAEPGSARSGSPGPGPAEPGSARSGPRSGPGSSGPGPGPSSRDGEGALYVRVSAGRFGDGRIDDLDDEELAARVTSELSEIAGIGARPFAQSVTRHERSFPQYLPGHGRRMGRVNDLLTTLPGIEVAGAVLGGIGIPACITSGELAAGRLAGALSR